MHVLMLNHNVRGRSTYFRAMGLARELVRAGETVTIMTISSRSRFRVHESNDNGVMVLESPDLLWGSLRTGWDPWDTVRRYFLGKRIGPIDIVHAFDSRPAVIFPGLALSRKMGIPLCSDWADWWGRGGVISATRPWPVKLLFGGVETFFEEHFRKYADLVTVTSRALERRALDLGLPRHKVHYIPSGADAERIRPVAKEAARNTLGLPHGVPIIEYMGFVQYDIALALEAFALVRREMPAARFLLVGPGGRKVDHLVQRLGISEGVMVTGVQPPGTMETWLGAADVLLLPYQDTLYNRGRGPIKLGDYLASGRPIVTNPVGEIGDLLQREQVGLLAGEKPHEFGREVLRLLRNPELAQRLGAKAREVAEGSLNWRHFGGLLLELYREVMANRVC